MDIIDGFNDYEPFIKGVISKIIYGRVKHHQGMSGVEFFRLLKIIIGV